MIKKIVVYLGMVLISCTGFSETKERKFVLSFDPVKAIHGSLAGSIHYKTSNFMTLSMPFSFGTNWIAGQNIKTLAAISDEKYSSSQLFGSVGLGTRFLSNRTGLHDGFFIEPRIMLEMRRFNLKNGDVDLVNSKRITLSGQLSGGYNWYFDNGLYIGGSIMVGEGFHMKNDVTVDKQLAHRLKDKSYIRNALSANTSSWRFEYGYEVSLGYSW